MDLKWDGSMYDQTKGTFSKTTQNCSTVTNGNVFASSSYSMPCTDMAQVSLRLLKEKKSVLVRISLVHNDFSQRGKGANKSDVESAEPYDKLYSVISKNLFLEAQQIDSKGIQ